MCWYMITLPPSAASKKWVRMTRSNSTMNCEPAMNGVPSTTSVEVARLAQTSSGIRQKRHARRAHGHDRDQEVDRGGDRRGAGELDADREEGVAQRRPAPTSGA